MAYNFRERFSGLLPGGFWPSWISQMPFTDFHQMDLDWILRAIRAVLDQMKYYFIDGGSKETIEEVMEEHPEWWPRVQDGAITKPKINPDFLPYIANDYVTPQMYGAVSDGVTDDTLALQQAIYEAQSGEKLLRIPAGTYKTGPLLVTNKIVIIGDGIENTVIDFDGTGPAFTIKPVNPTVWTEWVRVNIGGFTVKAGGGHGIRISETIRSVFHDIKIENADYGLFIDGTNNLVPNKNSVFNNTYRRIQISGANYGIYSDGIISDSHFNGVETSGLTESGYYLTSVSSFNVTFENCTVVGAKKAFEIPGLFRNLVITGCNLENITEVSILSDNSSNNRNSGWTISNNAFIKETSATNYYDFNISKLSASVFTANVYHGNGTHKGVLTDCSEVYFYANSINPGVTLDHNIGATNFDFGFAYKMNTNCFDLSPNIYADRVLTKYVKLQTQSSNQIVNIQSGTAGNTQNNTNFEIENGGWHRYFGTAVTTAERKALEAPMFGSMVFDTNLGKPVWRTPDYKWVDAAGTQV